MKATLRKKSGLNTTDISLSRSSAKVEKLPLQVRKLQDAPQRLLHETDIEAIFNDLCPKC